MHRPGKQKQLEEVRAHEEPELEREQRYHDHRSRDERGVTATALVHARRTPKDHDQRYRKGGLEQAEAGEVAKTPDREEERVRQPAHQVGRARGLGVGERIGSREAARENLAAHRQMEPDVVVGDRGERDQEREHRNRNREDSPRDREL
jgi:hypothetical protein